MAGKTENDQRAFRFRPARTILGLAGLVAVLVFISCRDSPRAGKLSAPLDLKNQSPAARVEFWTEGRGKNGTNYFLGLSGDKSDSPLAGTMIPGGPFTAGSREKADLTAIAVTPALAIVAAQFFSEAPLASVDGHVALLATDGRTLRNLDRVDYAASRPGEGKSRSEARAAVRAEDRDGDGQKEIVVTVTTHHPAAGGEKEFTVEEQYHFKMVADRLLRLGYQKVKR